MTTTLTRPERLPRTGDNLAPNGREFTWGPIAQTHMVGNIAVVEFLKDASSYGQSSAWADHGVTMFMPYVDGQPTGRAHDNLDTALVGAITYKRVGPNSQATEHYDLMTRGSLPQGSWT